MAAEIISGTEIAKQVRAEVAEGVAALAASTGVAPGLAVVLVGDDPASAVYVRNKGRAAEEVGIFSETYRLPQDTPQDEVVELVRRVECRRALSRHPGAVAAASAGERGGRALHH